MAGDSLLDRAIYTYADVDRLVGLPPGTARRWIDGYRRRGIEYPPVLRSNAGGPQTVTWGEMVETRLLAEFRNRRVSLQRLRPAVLRLREGFGPYPLARARPLLDVSGRELIRRVQDEVGLDRALSLVVVRNDQVLLDLPVRHSTESVDYDRGMAVALRPATITPDIRMDPQRAFGQPAVEGVRTEVLAQDYRAGESRSVLAELYGLTVDQVDQALRFELIAAAPPAA